MKGQLLDNLMSTPGADYPRTACLCASLVILKGSPALHVTLLFLGHMPVEATQAFSACPRQGAIGRAHLEDDTASRMKMLASSTLLFIAPELQ